MIIAVYHGKEAVPFQKTTSLCLVYRTKALENSWGFRLVFWKCKCIGWWMCLHHHWSSFQITLSSTPMGEMRAIVQSLVWKMNMKLKYQCMLILRLAKPAYSGSSIKRKMCGKIRCLFGKIHININWRCPFNPILLFVLIFVQGEPCPRPHLSRDDGSHLHRTNSGLQVQGCLG